MSGDRVLHIISGSSAERAEHARMGYELGYHAEIYSDIAEFTAVIPERGVILASDDGEGALTAIFTALEQAGRWLPLIATGTSPSAGHVVEVIREGALDYLSLPFGKDRLAASLHLIEHEAEPYCEARRRVIEARKRLSGLTPRENEVLDWLTKGSTNKVIARELAISPRTVEIHRANMMAKLGASHSAEAVRLCLEARMAAVLESPVSHSALGVVHRPDGPGTLAEREQARLFA